MSYLNVEKHYSHSVRKLTVKSKKVKKKALWYLAKELKTHCGISQSSVLLKVTIWKTSFCWLHRFFDRKQQIQMKPLLHYRKNGLKPASIWLLSPVERWWVWDRMALRSLVSSTLVLLERSVDKFNLDSVRANAGCPFGKASTKVLRKVLICCLEKKGSANLQGFLVIILCFYMKLWHFTAPFILVSYTEEMMKLLTLYLNIKLTIWPLHEH